MKIVSLTTMLMIGSFCSVKSMDRQLEEAIQQDNQIQVSALVGKPGIDLNAVNGDGYTPLLLAIRFKSRDAINILIAAGARINEKILFRKSLLPKELTPLIMAALFNDTSAVRMLIEANVELDNTNEEGKSALIIAAVSSYPVLNLLIQAGAQLNLQDKHGDTALMCAVRQKSMEAVAPLLNAGALTDLVNQKDKTALDIAKDLKEHTIVEVLEKHKLGLKEEIMVKPAV